MPADSPMIGGELTVHHTHRIGLWPRNQLILHSANRGWRDVYVALATVNTWSGKLAATGHPCLAYCLHRPAHLSRSLGDAVARETSVVRPRQFFIIPANEASEWHRHGTSDMLMMYLRQDMLDSIARSLGSRSDRPVSIDLGLGVSDPLLEQLALALLDTLRGPEDHGSPFYVDAIVHAMAAHLLRRYSKLKPVSAAADEPQSSYRLGRVLELIENSIGEDVSLVTLAEEAGMSPSSFTRAFSKTYGATVHQYILQRRVERAKSLLRATDEAIADIAYRTGFSSQSHLATTFKRLTGVTPGAYRHQCT
ncbi:helix-turn-helix transcriptional regulator [Bradyrhizobium roseum]|uniref:helix-turn-helix transcriptional regulator n=1 Tax=Bradyrhizobium roseum TaxID=3056648 RepID=UPI002613B304|nr:AraC family transcriptional regulator [Bradyrhizobium roseus]WKA26530.1 AraC family transcriptional regulator [Bradyrhizobium roseus]